LLLITKYKYLGFFFLNDMSMLLILTSDSLLTSTPDPTEKWKHTRKENNIQYIA
jgi:hypothetical protein